MFLLTPSDVEIIQVQHPKKIDKKISLLSYNDQTFRLLSVFAAPQEAAARSAWQDLAEKQGKICVLLEEQARYSLWQQINIDIELLKPPVLAVYAKACVLMVQALYGDVEQLLGAKQAKSFGAALSVSAAAQVQTVGGLGHLLRLDPLTEVLPSWEEKDLGKLLEALHQLGAKFFGRARFAERTLQSLDDLAPEDQSIFLSWLKASSLNELWLTP